MKQVQGVHDHHLSRYYFYYKTQNPYLVFDKRL